MFVKSTPRNELPVLPAPRLDLAAPDVAAPVAIAGLLADRSRAGILRLLRDGPHCVCEMAAALNERQNNVSNHLAQLREAGLVQATRHHADARWIYYERNESACNASLAELRNLLEPPE
jgi:ArsR family transcriptional regulator, arsenate/arsenite/antimonite-responsive transcriptional repressor